MGLFSKPAMPNFQLPPPSAHPPTMANTSLALAGLQSRQRARAAEGEGVDNTVKTSPQGVSQPSTSAPATLLGN